MLVEASGPGNGRSRTGGFAGVTVARPRAVGAIGAAGCRAEGDGTGTTDATSGTRGGPVGVSVRCGRLLAAGSWVPVFGVVFPPARSPDLRVDPFFAGACSLRFA
jgi:hypothetical protein